MNAKEKVEKLRRLMSGFSADEKTLIYEIFRLLLEVTHPLLTLEEF